MPADRDQDDGARAARAPGRSRRAVITSFALGAGAAGLGVAASLIASARADRRAADRPRAPAVIGGRNAPRRLKMVTTWPKNFPGLGTGAVRFARRIEEMSGGAIAVTVYAAGELVPALQAFDAVSQGKADMYHGAEYYWQGRSLAFNFFAAVPMGLLARELEAWVRFGGGQELWDELAARFSIKPMLAGNTGPQMGGWFKRPIRSLADFQGLRMRIPGLGGEVIKRMGGTPVTKAGGELFQALDQGNIDATEWVGPWNDMAFALHTIADYYYYPGFHEPGTGLSCGINLGVWNALDEAERAVIANAAAAETAVMHAEFEHENALALQRLLRIPRITIAPFPDDVQAAMARISAEVLEEVASRDPFTRRVYESFLAARERAMAWGRISDEAFARARRLARRAAEG
ncbi:MAG: C4-dicarboxylate ABC transporter [Rhodothalassiaceae bacterium]|nr:MAG: C4-dicarboxylate ABC transporter [Rhodothalassiaceae bacterium]